MLEGDLLAPVIARGIAQAYAHVHAGVVANVGVLPRALAVEALEEWPLGPAARENAGILRVTAAIGIIGIAPVVVVILAHIVGVADLAGVARDVEQRVIPHAVECAGIDDALLGIREKDAVATERVIPQDQVVHRV